MVRAVDKDLVPHLLGIGFNLDEEPPEGVKDGGTQLIEAALDVLVRAGSADALVQSKSQSLLDAFGSSVAHGEVFEDKMGVSRTQSAEFLTNIFFAFILDLADHERPCGLAAASHEGMKMLIEAMADGRQMFAGSHESWCRLLPMFLFMLVKVLSPKRATGKKKKKTKKKKKKKKKGAGEQCGERAAIENSCHTGCNSIPDIVRHLLRFKASRDGAAASDASRWLHAPGKHVGTGSLCKCASVF